MQRLKLIVFSLLLLAFSIVNTGCDVQQVMDVVSRVAQGVQQAAPAINNAVNAVQNVTQAVNSATNTTTRNPDAPATNNANVTITNPGDQEDVTAGGNNAAAPANNTAAPADAGQRGRFGASPSPGATRVSSEFGMRTHPISGQRRMHNGIDLPMPNGTRLNALGDGVVTAVGYESGGGRFVKIRFDNGMEAIYCHLQSSSVRNGQRVTMGQQIALSDNSGGSTGPHLHLGIKRNGAYINPRSAGIPLP